MQQEAFACLQAVGFEAHFAGEEDSEYPQEVIGADLVVALAPTLTRLPARCTGVTLLYTCNTHVVERDRRLQRASERWGLPLEGPSVREGSHYLRAYRRADYLLIAENEAGIANFVKHGVPPEKIRRYHNCVDVDVWVPAERKREKFAFVCYVSAHGLRKGLPALLAAWDRWYRGQAAELWLVGIPTPVSDQLLGSAREGEVRPGLHLWLRDFPAQHQPVIDFLGSCHVAVFPTLEDAQPSTLMEMASCGLAVITTVESGMEFTPDFCRYVEADSVEALCDALEYFYSRGPGVGDLGVRAREYILSNHSWDHFRRRFSVILREVAERHGIALPPAVDGTGAQ